ncbi:MAG: DNA-binding protein [Actinomycetota bacterium]|nr:DNA-binding protein [Actinomycetota bacterium]
MSYLADSRVHLDKAREFLESARDECDFERYKAAVSAAVISGINSKDVICLKATRRTTKTENHNEAVRELRLSGPAGASLETTFRRLLALKPKSQNQASSVSSASARDAVSWAQRMYDVAVEVVSRPS